MKTLKELLLSHLFVCYDGVCTLGEACIMRGGYDNITSLDQTNSGVQDVQKILIVLLTKKTGKKG